MNRFQIGLIGIFLTCSIAGASFNLQLSKTIREKGQYYDLTVSEEVLGDRLYIAGKLGIEIYSLDDPGNPVLLGGFKTNGLANGVAVNFPYVYVGDVYGFSIWDVSDIDHPVMRSEMKSDSLFGYQERLYYRDGKVFIAAYTSGFQIVDVSDPDRPFLAGQTRTGAYAWDMALSEDAAYIMDFFSMSIVDIRRPAFPVNRVQVSAMFSSGAVARDDLLFLGYIDGLRVMDISDPFNPVDVSDIGPTGSGTAETVALSGNYAYVGHGGYIEIYDISNPAKPVQVSYYYPPGHPRKLVVHEGYLYTVLDDSGFVVTDVTDPEEPFQRVHIEAGVWGTRKDVVRDGQFLYLIDWNRGLVIYDESVPGELIELSNYLVPGSLRSCVIDGNRAYLVGQSEIQIVDITDRTAPVLIGNYETSGSPYHMSIDVARNRIYLCDLYGFYILDMSDPSNIGQIGAIWLAKEGNPYASVVIGNYAYIANGWKGLKVLDISDPSDPELALVWPGDNSKSYVDIQIRNGLLHLLDPYNGIDILDVGNPVSPELVALVSAGDIIINDFMMENDLLYVAAGNSGIFVFDIKNPATPVLMARADTPGEALGICTSAQKVYVADRYDLAAFNRSEFKADSIVPAVMITYPQPLAQADAKTLTVYGTAVDTGSGIRKVEISTDSGTTWSEVFGQEIWSTVISGFPSGPLAIRARGVDWSGNIGDETGDVWINYRPPVPKIFLAGFETTRVEANEPATIVMSALVQDPWDEIYVDKATLYLNGQPTEFEFTRQTPMPGFLFFRLAFDQTFSQGGRPEFSIVITDRYQNQSNPWPGVPVRW